VDTGEVSSKGFPIYSSESLRSVWKNGRVQISEVTFDLALYVGHYITDRAIDSGDYGRMGIGIGESWITKYWKDVLVAGQVRLIGQSFPVPRYFKKKIEAMFPEKFKSWNDKRLLDLSRKKRLNIEKDDGPLRRARAKGRIFKHVQTKRRMDNGSWKE